MRDLEPLFQYVSVCLRCLTESLLKVRLIRHNWPALMHSGSLSSLLQSECGVPVSSSRPTVFMLFLEDTFLWSGLGIGFVRLRSGPRFMYFEPLLFEAKTGLVFSLLCFYGLFCILHIAFTFFLFLIAHCLCLNPLLLLAAIFL